MTVAFERILLSIVPEKYLIPIGKVITAWAWTEVMLDQAIWKLLGVTSHKGRAITSSLPASAKIETLETLMNLSRRNKSKLPHLAKEGKHLAAQRNLVAHGYVVNNDIESTSEVRFISYHARGSLTERSRRATPEIVDELAQRICRYNEFLIDFHDLLPASRNKPRRQANTDPNRRRRQMQTIAKRILPPLGWSHEELEAARQASAPPKHGKARQSTKEEITPACPLDISHSPMVQSSI
jgi:hypothetical protein